MTSMKCLNPSTFERVNGSIAIEGRDFLSPYQEENENFYAHNHVVIPYCSSDVWVADRVLAEERENTDCTLFPGYLPDAANLQFALRGRIIFQSVFNQLLNRHGMDSASVIMLAGSSAGGLGILNNAQWVRQTMPVAAELLLFVDSAWFINFQDNILLLFENTISTDPAIVEAGTDNSGELIDVLNSNPACNDTLFGYPCCFSAQCLLTQRNESGMLEHFPEGNVRMFILSSIYDVFLLAPSVIGSDSFDDVSTDDMSGLINFLQVVGEYGGEMNSTLSQTYNSVSTLTILACDQ